MKLFFRVLLVVGLASCAFQNADAQEIRMTLQKVKFGAESTQTIKVPHTETVAQEYTISVPTTKNVEQQQTINVPYTENVTQNYTVQIPYTETITGDDGSKKQVTKTRTETRTRTVPVSRVRTETRTKMVPVTKMENVTKTRMVPVTTMKTETRKTKFPPADATFAYASGAKIPVETLKELAAEQISILTLPPGQKLTELHRSVLKPELIVMTLPKQEIKTPKKKKQSSVGETSKEDSKH